ncbi:MAG TPA: hypothetical protein VFF65_10865 [Phycisphaerales bacterium]|nr:hypothetical protein [Phycisphaerales bacterium]
MTGPQQFIMRMRPWGLLFIGVLMAATIVGFVFAEMSGTPRRAQLIEMLIGQLFTGAVLAAFPLMIKAKKPK